MRVRYLLLGKLYHQHLLQLGGGQEPTTRLKCVAFAALFVLVRHLKERLRKKVLANVLCTPGACTCQPGYTNMACVNRDAHFSAQFTFTENVRSI